MRVKISVTLDVDPEAWVEEYAVERDGVREDVRRHATAVLSSHFESVGVLAS